VGLEDSGIRLHLGFSNLSEFSHSLGERILEIMKAEGWSSPRYIAQKVSLCASVGRVRERCRMLTYAQMIEPLTCQFQNDVALLLAHGVRSRCEHARAMGNGREQPGGVSIYDAREVRE
jgi:hypothetical protein